MKAVFIDAIVNFKFRVPPHPLSFTKKHSFRRKMSPTYWMALGMGISSKSNIRKSLGIIRLFENSTPYLYACTSRYSVTQP